MALSTKTFSDLTQGMVTAIQGAASSLVDLTVGSVLRAVVEANAAVVMWLQAIALQIAATTRLATSNGSDVDSFCADFGLTRLPATIASGAVTFARFTNTSSATVPVGAVVQTADGLTKFTVVADIGQVAYSATLNAYVLGVGVSSITATVNAQVAGAAGNVQAGLVNTIAGSIAGVDTVSNALGFSNGANAETDAALRARFVTYLGSLAKATKTAIGNAVTSVQQGVTYTLTENLTYGGLTQLDYFYVVVDDGTGTPGAPFLASVTSAIDAVRPVGSVFAVFAPVIVTANVVMTITTAAGYSHSTIVATVLAALQSYINTLPIGTPLPFSRLAQVAYGASTAVTNVTGVTLNSGTADLACTAQQIIKAGTISIT